jgi:hypothetical protein
MMQSLYVNSIINTTMCRNLLSHGIIKAAIFFLGGVGKRKTKFSTILKFVM